ncbi:Hsp70 protein-domain-containing protein [Tribonema minus]|uniref:Hsp70 protein-domain-containing protein n=1 Tax=Tribonema minus TaxID=303371 RepID=A0A835Z756_9STRA|nr:Hsp70 protein-domain-containing protein [Tribonema minus]
MPSKAVGIDLGTTNSAVALIEDGAPVIVPNRHGKRTTPSVVAWTSNDDIIVGDGAVAQRTENAINTFSSVKRLIGLTTKEARRAGLKLGAMGVDQGYDTVRLKCPVKGASLSPEQVSAEILKALVADAERHLQGKGIVRRAVIAVPAYFSEAQCLATERAGLAVGLEKVKIMREPEAAALAYGLSMKDDELVLVFDLGGGTFDVSVLHLGGGVVEVVATSGDPHLGGDDFDLAIADWMVSEVVKAGGADPRGNPVLMRTLTHLAQAARVRLTNEKETAITVPAENVALPLTVLLTRKKMETLCAGPIGRLLQPLREVAITANIQLEGEAGWSPDGDGDIYEEDNIAEPASADSGSNLEAMRKLRKRQGNARRTAKSRQKTVKAQADAFGRLQRTMTTGNKLHVFPQGRPLDQVVLVGGGTRMLCVQQLVQAVTGVKVAMTVNPDEAVALGAAVYAGIMDNEVQGIEVMTAWQARILREMARTGKLGPRNSE